MKIQVTQTLPNGQITQQVLSKDGAEVLKIQAQPGAKLSFNVEAGKPAGTVATKPKTGDIKKIGNNLVLESEGEALVEVSDFYSNAGASVGDVGWNYAATNVAATEATPEAQAMAADTAVAGSGALLPVIAPGWLVAGGVAAIAAGSSGGGGSNTSTSTPPNEGGGTPNNPPTAVNLTNAVASVVEVANNVATSARIKVADINVVDADGGTNTPYTVSNSAYFEADATGLYIKAGVVLDHETLKTLSTTVTANGVTSTAISVAVTDVNDAPTLTTVSTLTGFAKGAFKEISYADLAAAGNETDPENSALSFRVETVSTGTLQKWNATTSAWDSVVAGSTLVAAGEKLQWKAADGSSGTALNAFTVKAWDGALASAEAVQVKADVAASSSGGGGGGGASSNVVSGLIIAGPVVASHGLSVELFRADGVSLGVATVGTTGRFSQDVGTYTGVVLAKVSNNNNGADYKDEATGLDVDLGATLMAVGVISGSSLTLNINPLTTIAAQKAGLAQDGSGSITGAADADKVITVNNANAAVASAFGLSNITSTDPDTTNDGTTATNPIGALLAALSGQDAITGNAQITINYFVAQTTTPVVATVGELSSAAQTALLQGAAMADPAGTLGLVNAVSDSMSAAVTTSGFTIGDITTDNIIKPADSLSTTTTLTGTVATGTTLTDVDLKIGGVASSNNTGFSWIGTTWTYTLSAADVVALTTGADGALAVELTVSNVTKGRRMVLKDFTDDQPAAVKFFNVVANIYENAVNTSGTKVADINIADLDGYNGGLPTLSGADALSFEVKTVTVNADTKYELWFLNSVTFDKETKASYDVIVTAGTTASATLNVHIENVNEAPTGTSSTITIQEDLSGGRVLTAADFGLVDAADSPVNSLAAVIITTLPAVGTLTLNGVAVTLNQSIAVADLPNLVYAPALNANGTGYATIGFKVQDNGGTANGGVDTSTTANTLTIDVTALNDAPVNTVPTAKTVNEDTDLAVTGLSVADVDAGSSNITVTVTVTLSVTHGTITVASNIAGGLASGGIATNGTASVVLTGTVAAINATLAGTNGVVYKGALNYNGSDTLTMLTSDGGNTGTGGTLTDSDTVAITVTAVNDTPTSTALGNGIELPAATFGTAFPSYDAKTALAITDVEDSTTLVYSLVGAPTWLSINSSGVISGTAPALGSTGAPAAGDLITFQVKATDSGGLLTQQTVSLHIYNSPQVLSIARATMANVDSNGNTAATGDIDFTIIFNKTDVIGATAGDFTVSFTPTGGSATNLTALTDFTLTQGVDAAHYTLKVLAAKVGTLLDGTLAVTAVGGDIHDTANNPVNSILPTGASNQTYVLDHVNQAPTFASSTAIATAINEGTAASTVIFTAAAIDPDLTAPNKTLIYSIGGTDVSKFDINTSTGAVSLKPAYTYDFETKPSYSFTVTATDSGTGALNATQTVSLAINNVNEAPTLAVGFNGGGTTGKDDYITLARGASLNNTLLQNDFADPDAAGAIGTLTYSLASGAMPMGLTLNADGSITGIASATAGDYTVHVLVTDHGVIGDTVSKTLAHDYTLHLVDAPTLSTTLGGTTNLDVRSALVFSVTEDVNWTANGTYDFVITNAANGTGKTGFRTESTAHTQTIHVVVDAMGVATVTGGSVTIDHVNNKIVIDPTFDLDLSNNYTLSAATGAFTGVSSNQASQAFTSVSFSTVTPGSSTNFYVADPAGDGSLPPVVNPVAAAASVIMNTTTGEKDASLSWVDVTNATAMGQDIPYGIFGVVDASAKDYAFTLKNINTSSSTMKMTDTWAKFTNFGAQDLIYIDNQFNDGFANWLHTGAFSGGKGSAVDPFSFTTSGSSLSTKLQIVVDSSVVLPTAYTTGPYVNSLLTTVNANHWSDTGVVIAA